MNFSTNSSQKLRFTKPLGKNTNMSEYSVYCQCSTCECKKAISNLKQKKILIMFHLVMKKGITERA